MTTMKAMLPLTALLLAGGMAATARIGETEAECAARYGEPYGEPVDDVMKDRAIVWRAYGKGGLSWMGWLFGKGKLIFIIGFRDGKAESIQFQNMEKKGVGNPVALTEAEIDVLLKANGGKRKWKWQMVADGFTDGWKTEDGELVAVHPGKDQSSLKIATKEANQRWKRSRAEKEAAAAKARLEGL